MRIAAIGLSIVFAVVVLGCKKNQAPDTPAVPSGPASCAVGVSYTFSSSATDPDGDSIAIRFDWGDGDTSDWSSRVVSGETLAMSHSWAEPGTLAVRSQARDSRGDVSLWSGGHTVGVPAPLPRGWARTFGGTNYDEGYAVAPTQDGGYVVTGYTGSQGAGGADVWLFKVDSAGNKVWDRTYGGTGNEWGFCVQQTQDGGYIVAASGYSFGAGSCDYWLIKTDANGDTVWTRTFGGVDHDMCKSVQQTQDGGYILVGSANSYGSGGKDCWLVRIDPNGTAIWDRAYGGIHYDFAQCVRQTLDGGFIVAGYSDSYGAGRDDFWLIKTDSNGDTSWTRTYGGSDWEDAFSVEQTTDGGYIIVGYTGTHAPDEYDVWLVKTDANGGMTWSKTFGGTAIDQGSSVQQTQDGGYVIVGYTKSYGAGGSDIWLIKMDGNGDTTWTRTFGGLSDDAGSEVRQTQDGGYIIAGTTGSYGAGLSDVWLIKTDADGMVDGTVGPLLP